ncbi:MAG: DNA mismatch repair endonuclease MutL [Rickettsiales bacterium]|jgi:DNA mismatch repair protein MutL|nr:DNA mismatch repair endonuclease MutL [Rickettsiales bacterium]
MNIRILPENLIDQIAAGEVVERPANVVKELVENALDAGGDQIVIDVADGGRTMINVTDNGCGMSRADLVKSILRHATSKLPDDDLLNINFMGFRGEALPSISSVSDMTVDTCNGMEGNGWTLDCNTGETKPSPWESGTRIRVANLFAKTPARLKFLRTDRAEMMSVVEVVKRLAMARPDAGFILNNRWRFPKGQSLEERIISVMGEDVRGRMLRVEYETARVAQQFGLSLHGFVSEPTLRRASSVDQYLFVNGRPVKDKVLVGALRAAYMDVMNSREFPLCALYLKLDSSAVDVNVSPAKTEVHFLEPAKVRGFIISAIRRVLSTTIGQRAPGQDEWAERAVHSFADRDFWAVRSRAAESIEYKRNDELGIRVDKPAEMQNHYDTGLSFEPSDCPPLGRVIGQIGSKYILAENGRGLVIIDQHAAHERIVYEQLRAHSVKVQPLLAPMVINLNPESVAAILEIKDELKKCGLTCDQFGEDSIAIFEKPADWEMDWAALLRDISDEVSVHGHSSILHEKLHLKLANHACHHSVRAGQKLNFAQMDALLRDIENTERAGQCNHGRPVYKIIKMSELDGWFER